MPRLQSLIERLASSGEVERNPEARKIFLEFREQLTLGKIRAAEKVGGRWTVHVGSNRVSCSDSAWVN